MRKMKMTKMTKKIVLTIAMLMLGYSSSSKNEMITARFEVKREAARPAGKKTKDHSPRKKTAKTTKKAKAADSVLILAYIEQFKDVAKANMLEFGIPCSIILAQGILESSAGTGILSRDANNHFGIKCHKGWKGPSVRHDDDSPQECFRKYQHPLESYKDHSLFLKDRSWYASLFELKKDDYKAWAKGLKAAGYATDRRYDKKLISIIERYKLDKLDAEVLENKDAALLL
jgi:flagellum-specific peptidoglycan hydrolase FlgJ